MVDVGRPSIGGWPLTAQDAGGAAKLGLPAGTVTFLLSDVEGSTRLWSEFPEAMPAAVAQVYAILDEAVAAHDGVRPMEQGEGDSVVAAFSRASDALAAALQAQRALHTRPWPDEMELGVRIALHTADAQLRDEGNYFGIALSRCARIRAIAPCGQTLLSHATHDLVADRLPDGVELLDCGEHRLRDLGRPERIFALVHPELPAPEPALLAPLDAVPTNLPGQLSSFVGREHELEELRAALGATRMLTLTGAGGSGKTRLALALAGRSLEDYPDGVWWIDLASQMDAAVLGEAIAEPVGVRPLPGTTALQAVCAALVRARTLVVLDNCEHLLEACAEAATALLESCRNLKVLATSRAPLGLPGESDWRVPPLALPEEPGHQPVESLSQYDAVKLFIERAMKARSNFAVTNDNAPAVAQICSDLDGIPLAIELAAARVRMLSTEQIAAGLADRFHLLTGGPRGALPRLQTLRASVEWSHALLEEPERILLRRLAVFHGGFTLDACEAVCAGDDLERYVILDMLTSLVDKSLVLAEERESLDRYALLETIRHYALERLGETGEAAGLRDRHADAFLDLAESTAPILGTDPGSVDVLGTDAANVYAAIDHTAQTEPDKALRLCTALAYWWLLTGRLVEARTALTRALDATAGQRSTLRCSALFWRGYLAFFAADHERARQDSTEALALAQELGD